MQLENWKLDRFIEYANNPRINDPAVDKVVSAINEFGFRVPVVAKSDGSLVDGHLRLKAARKLKLETIPVLLADDLTDAQINAFRISVNQMASLAEWDIDLLKIEIEGLEKIDSLGFDELFLSNILNGDVCDPFDEWDDMPEFNSEDKTAFSQIIVKFDDQKQVDEFAKYTGNKITDKTKSVYFKGRDSVIVENMRYK